MLQKEDDKIIRWKPDGIAFEITDTEALATEILPKYFRHTKFASFQRQLNYFGFKKWSKSKTELCTYSRDFFTKFDMSPLCNIRRKTSGAPPTVQARVKGIAPNEIPPPAARKGKVPASKIKTKTATVKKHPEEACPATLLRRAN